MLWNLLKKVRKVTLSADDNGVSRKGRAVVTACENENVISFDEQGEWEDGISFHNHLQWIREHDKISLRNLRQGHLVEFDAEGKTLQPHICGKDCYEAEISSNERGILLKWKITGPKKKQRLECFYEF